MLHEMVRVSIEWQRLVRINLLLANTHAAAQFVL
jgi:hypothetical protein